MLNLYPRRRMQQMSIQHVGQEVLIYDEQTHRAFCLNPIAAAVWNRCDGATPVAAIATSASLALAMPITQYLVQLALQDLQRDGLLEAAEATNTTISRRAAMLKLGARAALLLPVVVAITSPTPAHAYSGCANCSNAAPTPQNTDIFSAR